MEEDKALTNAQKRQDPHSWFLSTASGEPPALLQEAQCRIALDLGNSCWRVLATSLHSPKILVCFMSRRCRIRVRKQGEYERFGSLSILIIRFSYSVEYTVAFRRDDFSSNTSLHCVEGGNADGIRISDRPLMPVEASSSIPSLLLEIPPCNPLLPSKSKRGQRE